MLGEKVKKAYKATSEFVKKNKEYCVAGTFFLTTRALDMASTKMNLTQAGVEAEISPVTNLFMRAYSEVGGTDLGMLAGQISISIAVLLGTYYVNQKNLKRLSGTNLLNGAAVAGMGIAAINFLDYFNVPYYNLPIVRTVLEHLC